MSINLGTAFVSIIPEVQGIQGDLFSGMRGVDQAADEAGSKAGGIFSGGFGKILKGGAIVASVAALGEAAGAAFSATFGKAMEAQSATAKASAQLGLSDADATGLGKSAGKLYAQAYGDSLGSVTESLAVVKSSLKGLGADELEGATKKALSFSEAFDVDMARSVQTVSTLMGSGLATNADQAFDLITKASQKVPAALREDVLDASDEYSQFFSALGFDANEAFGALTSASDKGVFGIDKTGDAIKEFTIRATDMSASTVGAFSAIGLDAQSMANQILAGGDTAQGATQQIIDGLLAIQDPATQANTAIALFGTPLEDLGVSSVPQFLSSLDDASGGLGDFAGAAAEVDSKLGGTIESKFTSATRSIGRMGSALGQGLLPLFGPVLDGITNLASKGSEKLALLEGPLVALTSGDYDPAKWAPGIMEDAPIVSGLLAIHDGFSDAAQGAREFFDGLTGGTTYDLTRMVQIGESVRDVFMEIGGAVGGQFMEVWDQLGPALSEVGKILGPAVVDIFTTLWEAVKPLLPTLMDLMTVFNPIGLLFKALVPLLPQIASLVADLGKVLADGLARALQAVAPLFQAIVDVVNRLLPFITDLVASLLPPLMRLFESLVPLISGILDALMPVVELIVASLIPVIEALMPVVERVFTYLADTIGNFVDIITGVIEVITGVFTGDWEKVWTGVKDIFGGIWDQIKNVVGTLVDLLGMVGGQLLDWVGSLPGLIGEKLSALGQWMVDRGVEFLAWLATGIATKGAELGQWFADLPGVLWSLLAQAAVDMANRGGEFLQWLWNGITTKAEEVKVWFLGLPGVLWGLVAQAAVDMANRGGQFLQWLWDGITTKAEEVKTWFLNLPGVLWNSLLSFAGGATIWLIGKGQEFIGWIKDGIVGAASGIWDFFTALPQKVWDLITGLGGNMIQLGKNLVGWIAEGITNAAKSIWDALTKALEFDPVSPEAMAAAPQSSTGGYNSNNAPVITNPFAQRTGGLVKAQATGGMTEFLETPGHQWMPNGLIRGPGGPMSDLIPTWLSNREFVGRASSVERYQPAYEALNAHRPADALAFLMGVPGALALGGAVQPSATKLGEQISQKVADGIRAGADAQSAAAGIRVGGGRGGFFDGLLQLGNAVVNQLKMSTAGGFAGNGQWGPATDGSRLADNTLAAKNFITGKWGITDIGGVYGGSVPGSDHPVGKALDVMIANYKSQQGIAQGTSVADWFVNNPNAFGTKYVIWRDRINQGGAWAPYQHPSGSDDNLQHRNHVHLSFLTGSGQFSGQPVGDTNAMGGMFSNLIASVSKTVGEKFGLSGTGTPSPVAGGQFSPNVERWRGLATKALAAFGYGSEWVNPMLWQMTTESGGDPRALNDWDRNFPLYGGSKGLLQTIQPTFESALRGTPYANLIPLGPYDPWANLLAAVSYVQREYGGPSVWNKSVGGSPNPYDWGGWLMPGDQGINLGGRPEAVLTPVQSDAYVTHAKAIAGGGFGGLMPQLLFSFDSSDPLQVAVVQMLRQSQVELLQNVRTKAAQGA